MEKLDPEVAEVLLQLVQANSWWLENQDSPAEALIKFSNSASKALSVLFDIESSLLCAAQIENEFTMNVDDAMRIVKANYSNLPDIERAFFANTNGASPSTSLKDTAMKPHPYAELIKRWADGELIQKYAGSGEWIEVPLPTWDVGTTFRVKPASKSQKF